MAVQIFDEELGHESLENCCTLIDFDEKFWKHGCMVELNRIRKFDWKLHFDKLRQHETRAWNRFSIDGGEVTKNVR